VKRPVRKADNLPPSCSVVTKSGNLKFLELFGPVQACNVTALPLPLLLPLPLPVHKTMPFEADHYEGRLKLVLWNDITLYTLSSRK